MRLVERPAVAALPCDSDKPLARCPRGIHVMIDRRGRRVADTEARAAQSPRYLGLFLVTRGAGAEAFVERTDYLERRCPKSHVRAEHAAHLYHFFALIDGRQIK